MFLTAAVVAIGMMGVAASAPAAMLRIAPWCFPRGRMLSYVGLVGALAFLLTVVGRLVVPAASPAFAALAAATITLAVVGVSVRSLRPLQRARSLARSLARDSTGPRAGEVRHELLRLVAVAKPGGDARGYGVHASLVLTVVGALADARLWDDAVAVLETLDETKLSPNLHTTHAVSLANCRLYLGDRDGARAELARIARPAELAVLAESAAASEALLLSVEGRGREALSALGALGRPREPRLGRAHEITRAHAHQALGESEEARAALHRLREAHGQDGLLRVQALNGPASPLATALLRESDTPYRG